MQQVGGKRFIGDVVALDIEAEILPPQPPSLLTSTSKSRATRLSSSVPADQRTARWLTATLPRINKPAANIAGVTGSPRNSQAKAAPNSGTR